MKKNAFVDGGGGGRILHREISQRFWSPLPCLILNFLYKIMEGSTSLTNITVFKKVFADYLQCCLELPKQRGESNKSHHGLSQTSFPASYSGFLYVVVYKHPYSHIHSRNLG
jgi:hypothetical protein